jgi:DNA-directed RNA polymerase subunit RPC12/RpoP
LQALSFWLRLSGFCGPLSWFALLVAVGYFSASKYSYQCPNCKKEFKITSLQDFFAPHGISRGPNGELYERKLLKCPLYGKRDKSFRVESAKDNSVSADQ